MSRTDNYTKTQFLHGGSDGHWFKKKCMRPDLINVILYSFGAKEFRHDAEKVPLNFTTQLEWIQDQMGVMSTQEFRLPGLVLSVGEGRGELAAAYARLRTSFIGVDPSPGSEELIPNTIKTWAYGENSSEFWNTDIISALPKLDIRKPDTVIFSESIEHIPMEEGDLIIERAKEWGALLIVSNVLDFHPIKIDNTGWNHIRLIDDDLYDSIEAMGTLVYRNKSNLIVQF